MSNIIKAEYVVFDNNHENKASHSIKTDKPQTDVISTSKENLYEIYNQREIILKEANEEALKIIGAAKRNAQKDILECKKRGYDEGYNAGMEVGKNKGYNEGYETGKIDILEKLQNENKLKLEEIKRMLEMIENQKEEIVSKYSDDLNKLSIEIAEKIIRQKIDGNDSIISGIIRNVIKDYRNTEWIKIHISGQDDVINIQADKGLINNLKKISNDVKFEVSEDSKKGSIIVETPDCVVDASIDTQLENLKEMVLSKNAV